MQKVLKFCRLSIKQKLLFISAFFLTGIVRLLILVIPFKWLALVIGEKMADSPSELDQKAYQQAAKIGWAVTRISRYTPWQSKCLVQAITTLLYLKFFRIPYTLYLGLDKDQANNLIAHAWLRCGELIVTGGGEQDRFQVVARFAGLAR